MEHSLFYPSSNGWASSHTASEAYTSATQYTANPESYVSNVDTPSHYSSYTQYAPAQTARTIPAATENATIDLLQDLDLDNLSYPVNTSEFVPVLTSTHSSPAQSETMSPASNPQLAARQEDVFPFSIEEDESLLLRLPASATAQSFVPKSAATTPMWNTQDNGSGLFSSSLLTPNTTAAMMYGLGNSYPQAIAGSVGGGYFGIRHHGDISVNGLY